MAVKYHSLIVDGLKEFGDSNLLDSDLEAIAWIGLRGTDYYNDVLSGSERDNIEANITLVKGKANENCN